MKFELTQTKRLFRDDEEDEMNKFKKLGFIFKEYKGEGSLEYYQYTLDTRKDLFIEINNLEELLNFVEQFGEVIIGENSIEIYNDYKE